MRFLVVLALCAAAVLAAGKPTPNIVVKGDGYFPVMIRLKDGSLLSVVRAGGAHVGRGGRLDMISSTDGGKTWPKRWTVIDDAEDDRNPALGQLNDGTIVLGYVVLSGFGPDGKTLSRKRAERNFDGVWVMRSNDGGKTWTKPEKSAETGKLKTPGTAISPYGKIVQLKDGAALMTVYYEMNEGPTPTYKSYVFRSKDSGKTWGDPSLIHNSANETAITVLPDGSLLAAARLGKGASLQVTRSTDGGRTWSAPTQVTKDMEHPADLIVLKDGRVLMTFGERNPPRGVHALISSDKGQTWGPAEHILLADDAPNGDCGYPSSWEVSPGQIVTMYYQVDDIKNAPASASARTVLWRVPAK
ncbi:MAG: exo-alpha-sialidase [Bryobacterales bacterium]|nr:exo-alpha-sialidase [Bryobacterales bacterium]